MGDDTQVQTTRNPKGTFLMDVKRIMADTAGLLPRHMTGERMVKLVYAAATKQPELLNCTTASIGMCLTTCSELGLEPGDVRGHVYLIPRKNSAAKITECTLLVGYKGFAELARRSGEIASIDATVVYEGEPFEVFRGAHPDIKHTWCPDVDRSNQKIVAAYAIARLKDGSIAFEVLTKAEIDARRKRSSASGSGPWVTDYARMARKSALRALFMGGLVPLSAEIVRAIEEDADNETIEATASETPTGARSGALASLHSMTRAALEAGTSETQAEAQQGEQEALPPPTPDLADALDRMTLAQSSKEIDALLKGAADWHPADRAPLIEAAAKRKEALRAGGAS